MTDHPAFEWIKWSERRKEREAVLAHAQKIAQAFIEDRNPWIAGQLRDAISACKALRETEDPEPTQIVSEHDPSLHRNQYTPQTTSQPGGTLNFARPDDLGYPTMEELRGTNTNTGG